MVPASLNDRFVIRFCVCAQHAIENDITYAYNVIAQYANDLFDILRLENGMEGLVKRTEVKPEDEESADEVLLLDRKKNRSLRYKRSFFVRMVSDPKLYNPKIVNNLSFSSTTQTSEEGEPDNAEYINPI
jgi:TDC-1 protein (fragment)